MVKIDIRDSRFQISTLKRVQHTSWRAVDTSTKCRGRSIRGIYQSVSPTSSIYCSPPHLLNSCCYDGTCHYASCCNANPRPILQLLFHLLPNFFLATSVSVKRRPIPYTGTRYRIPAAFPAASATPRVAMAAAPGRSVRTKRWVGAT